MYPRCAYTLSLGVVSLGYNLQSTLNLINLKLCDLISNLFHKNVSLLYCYYLIHPKFVIHFVLASTVFHLLYDVAVHSR